MILIAPKVAVWRWIWLSLFIIAHSSTSPVYKTSISKAGDVPGYVFSTVLQRSLHQFASWLSNLIRGLVYATGRQTSIIIPTCGWPLQLCILCSTAADLAVAYPYQFVLIGPPPDHPDMSDT